MRRLAVATALMALLCALAGASPARSSPTAHSAAAVKKCKPKGKKGTEHKRHHGKRRWLCTKTGADGSPGSTPGASGPPARLLVTEKEYTLQLSRPVLPAGSAIVEQYNHGEDPHDLRLLKVSDSTLYSFAELAPEQTARQTLALSAGTWQLFCSISDHQARGMNAFLTVN